MKRLLSVIIASAMLVITLAACSGGTGTSASPSNSPSAPQSNGSGNSPNPPPDEKVTIRLDQFSASNDTENALKAMIAAFNVKYPDITVELQSFGYDDYFTQLQSKVVGGNAADVFELNYENFVAYASEGVLKDITNDVGDTSGFNPTALGAFKYQGAQYGIPNSFSNVVLIYNKALFDQAGIGYPTDEWTWTDMLAAAKTIRALSADTFGLFRPLTFNEFYKGVQQNGGSLMSADGKKFTVNLPQNAETLTAMAGWITDSNVMPSDAQMGGMGDWDLFKSGRLGMIITGVWAFADFAANCDFEWDIVVEPGNTQKATHFFSNAYAVNNDSAHPEAAAALASFLAGNREAAEIRVAANWELPPVTYSDILEDYLKITPPANRAAVFKSLDSLVTPPVVKQQAEMQEIINRHLSSVLSGSATSQDALDACQKELEQKITLE
ncbi:sugar ABC transporter substrate-binding protein [Clostridia bacterium]|nr:sugar ABC transporter substrate-binding protein [Clostridia bacterium]